MARFSRIGCAVALAVSVAGCGGQESEGDLGRPRTGEVSDVGSVTENIELPGILPVADTTLKLAAAFANFGNANTIEVTSAAVANLERGVVRFDQAAIAAAVGTQALYSARIDFTTVGISAGWLGGSVDIMRMTRTWPEGDGTTHGPSWVCADDTNASPFGNLFNDCTPANGWGMLTTDTPPKPFAVPATDRKPIFTSGPTTVSFNVTADVQKFLTSTQNFGWMLAGTTTLASGQFVNFASRESGNGPRLVLDVGPDLCPTDPQKGAPGQCGCGVPDTDVNLDGSADCQDTVVATADTTLRLAIPFGNDGTGALLGVTSASIASLERTLVRVDTAAIEAVRAGRNVDAAYLNLNIAGISAGFGSGQIQIHTMNRGWPEGNGLAGHGPSWFCADDTNTTLSGLNNNDCTPANAWGMVPGGTPPIPYSSVPTDTRLLRFPSINGSVRFDVTADVQRFVRGAANNNGWLIKGAETLLSGQWVNFGSRETGAPPTLLLKLSPKCPDSDGDTVSDCLDKCPTDPAKTTPGVCGCNRPETDTPDADGIPNCIDFCPADPAKSAPGQCGCSNNPKPAGTPCSDGISAGVSGNSFTCNGAGQCGDPNTTSPDPGKCVPKVFGTTVYWVCSGAPTTWTNANLKCSAVAGQQLARVETQQENALLARIISGPAWLGGQDTGSNGTWHWAKGSNPNGDIFFSSGAPVNGLYTNFRAGTPQDVAGRCLQMQPGGDWIDAPCGTNGVYVCERSLLTFSGGDAPDLGCPDMWPGLTCNRDPSCVASDPNLPATEAVFRSQIDTCRLAGCTGDGAPGCSQCVGAALVPPPTSRCAATDPTPCGLDNPHGSCTTSANCPAGEICSLVYSCAACDQRSGQDCTAICPGVRMCGTRKAGCDTGNSATERCGEVNLCAAPGAAGDPNPFNDPGSNLTTTTFNPAVFGTPPTPAPTYPADPACATPPCSLGQNNGWCKYNVNDNLAPKTPPSTGKHGHAGKGGLVTFDFDPDLNLSFDATPLPLGESRFNLVASASLGAGATFNLPGVGASTFRLVDADIRLEANRCQASSTKSRFKIFGKDFFPTQAKFDTNPTVVNLTQCEKDIAAFETSVHRAKKALKDAQELLRQYTAAKTQGKRLLSHLCQQIVSDPPLGFPAGNCNTESAEATINRFISFYSQQARAATLTQIALAGKVLGANLPQLSLGDDLHTETQSLVSATFLVGPIPVTMSLGATESYGVGGNLNFNFNPGAFIVSGATEIAHISGDVHPLANAGVTLFLGVGFDIGIASASAGVEGGILLGNITVPIVAGAGIEVDPLPETRPLPAELASIAGPLPEIALQQYKFRLKYDYGVSAHINKILSGYLAARVHVSFLFFSKTWRKTLVDFGSGFSLPEVVLVKGDTSGPAIGPADWATVQMPMPFISIAPLPVPDPGVPPDPTVQEVAFDNGQVEKLFYDSQCKCDFPGDPCFRSADCCPQAPMCFSDPQTQAKTCSACRSPSQTCNNSTECCPGMRAGCVPESDTPGAKNVCLQCLANGRRCDPLRDTCCGECRQGPLGFQCNTIR